MRREFRRSKFLRQFVNIVFFQLVLVIFIVLIVNNNDTTTTTATTTTTTTTTTNNNNYYWEFILITDVFPPWMIFKRFDSEFR